MKPTPVVTHDSLRAMIITADSEKRMRIIGRALVAMWERQLPHEKKSFRTTNHNGRGFCANDSVRGSFDALSFKRTRMISPARVQWWIDCSPSTKDMRILRYTRQLNEIAQERAMRSNQI